MMRFTNLIVLGISLVLVETAVATVAGARVEANRYRTEMPATFTKNLGQWPEEILFRASDHGTVYWFTKNGIYYQFTRKKGAAEAAAHNAASMREANSPSALAYETLFLKAHFINSNPEPHVRTERLIDYKCNYFLGDDPAKWRTEVPNYESITYEDVYEGINLTFYKNRQQLECHLTVSPGSDLSRLQIEYENVSSLAVNGRGELRIETSWGELRAQVPDIHTMTPEAETDISIQAQLCESNSLGFTAVGGTARSQALIFSPGLVFSTLLGGGDWEEARCIQVELDSIYIAGETASANFPTTGPVWDHSYNLNTDVFLCRMTPNGNQLFTSTYLGGSGLDQCRAMEMVPNSSLVVVAGWTNSSDFPMNLPFDNTANGSNDAFVSVLPRTFFSLGASTYFGGTLDDRCQSMRAELLDSVLYVWLTGVTQSTNLPTVDAYDVSHNGSQDVFLAEILWPFVQSTAPSNAIIGYSTYFGGSSNDEGLSIAVDAVNGRAYITGYTGSLDFATVNAIDNTLGSIDAFVAGFDEAGNGQVYPLFSTYLGGPSNDKGSSIIRTPSGELIVAGDIQSNGLATPGAFQTALNGLQDVFLAKISASGSTILQCTYVGGSVNEGVNPDLTGRRLIDVDLQGNIYLTGHTESPDFPSVSAFDASLNGLNDLFVVKFSPDLSSLLFGTYLGGTDVEWATGIEVISGGCVLVTGYTQSSDFPVLDPYDGALNGGSDAFVTKLCIPTCGDADGTEFVTISDAVFLINYIFAGGPAPNPLLNGDADCNSLVTISDAVYLINFIFAGGLAPCASC